MGHNLILIKLGGSVITFKEKPLAANFEAIRSISYALASVKIPIILIHGGGSFGHYWSVKYNMHSKPDQYDSHGISIVHESMIALNQIIVNYMIKVGMNPYMILPSVFTSGRKPIAKKIKELKSIVESSVIPISFGDIIYIENKMYSILSGDALMSILSKILRPSKVIFTLNVDGIYKDMGKREIIKELKNNNNSINFSKVIQDVTGGMRRKVTEALKISDIGIDVLMVNGLKPERIINAITGTDFEGTLVKGKRSSK
ncbi:MAG: isopentenyl phosphate kinase [Nitrososphaeraceae archaeon]|jgi:isopentenyl phosphate kinase